MIILSEDETRKLIALAGRAQCEFRHALTLAIDHACEDFAEEMNAAHDAYEAERTRKWEEHRAKSRPGGAGVRRGKSKVHDGDTVPIRRGISKVANSRPQPPPAEPPEAGRERDSSGRWSAVGDAVDGAAIDGGEGTDNTESTEGTEDSR